MTAFDEVAGAWDVLCAVVVDETDDVTGFCAVVIDVGATGVDDVIEFRPALEAGGDIDVAALGIWKLDVVAACDIMVVVAVGGTVCMRGCVVAEASDVTGFCALADVCIEYSVVGVTEFRVFVETNGNGTVFDTRLLDNAAWDVTTCAEATVAVVAETDDVAGFCAVAEMCTELQVIAVLVADVVWSCWDWGYVTT